MAFDLGALLSEMSAPDTGREQIEYIALNCLDNDPNNFYALRDLDQLADNIATCGLQQPIRVRRHPDSSERYIIVSGHRRRAALELLAKEEPDRWSEVPCIVERDDVSPSLQQLRLIYANAHTRQLTAAEISEQAVQVEKLLYQLKAEGHAFPGRMRDHVATAVGASKSKLSRLKVIREHLAKVWAPAFTAGELTESAAYALAKMEVTWQHTIYYGLRDRLGTSVFGIHEVTAEGYRAAFEKIAALECTVRPGLCSNRAGLMQRSLKTGSPWDACRGCCMDCDSLARCGASCFLADAKKRELNQKRKAELAQAKAEAKAQSEADEILITATYDRARVARERQNVSAEDLLVAAGMDPIMHRFYTDHESGRRVITKNTGLAYLSSVSVDAARQLLAVSDRLGCSIDYLLGRDVPGPGDVPDLGPAAGGYDPWADAENENPTEPGNYVVLSKWSESGTLGPHIYAWDGSRWLNKLPDGDDLAAAGCIICSWIPLPEGSL